MGNIRSLCCPRENPDSSFSGDDRNEQFHIRCENGNYQQYGSCSIAEPTTMPAPTSTPPPIYKIILPKEIDLSGGFIDFQTSNLSAVIKEEYHSEKFGKLRSFLFRDNEAQEKFRELLWSCIPWSAPGGKSGSTFMKTIDDQFILKQMSKLELQSFETISDKYFNYVEESYLKDQPSLLSTILGIYRIVYTDSTTQACSEFHFMVMKNLFYNRNISQRFDLKGSMRNRLVETDDPDNNDHVLLDENLIRIAGDCPLYIRAKSKKVLMEAIDKDSNFLASNSVMDYSLLVGVDKDNMELILGIIDYVRPFTWDKKIERVVKSVISTEMPTIVEPELYQQRFCKAMNDYFMSVPDDWKFSNAFNKNNINNC